MRYGLIASPSPRSCRAQVELKAGALYYTDLGSTNGSFLNGVQLDARVPLATDDVLRLGGTEFKVVVMRSEATSLPL